MRGLRAGVGTVRLPTRAGLPMMGYGARTAPGGEEHDPLFARALYLTAGGEALLVQCDLCLLAPVQAEWVRARIAERTGIAPARILVGCTHTHSGPDTGLWAALRGEAPAPDVAALLDAAVRAACQAFDGAASARLGVGVTQARIGRNRRRADGPLDPEVLVVRVDRANGSPLAVLWNHGCHPTALGHDNLLWSADWPGAARRAIEAALPGATALFVLGAHADVDPRTRGLQDLAVSGRSRGVPPQEMEALGREVGDAVATSAAGLETRADGFVDAASARLDLCVHGAEAGPAAYAEALAARRREALEALGLDPDAEIRTADLFRLEQERTRELAPDERRERIARVRLYARDRSAPRFAGGLRASVETQVVRLGEAVLLGLPLEATVRVGQDWKARAGARAAVCSIANGWLRYLPHPQDHAEPNAHQAYEVLLSTFVPDAATHLLDVGEALLQAVR